VRIAKPSAKASSIPQTLLKKVADFFKTPLTNPTECGIMNTVKREKAPSGIRPIQADRKKGDKKKWSHPPIKKVGKTS